MDANKLIRIISKDLEELKTLTFEIAESETDSSLIIDLALSRARLLCQEIELLKEVTVKPFIQPDETEEKVTDSEEEEEEVSSVSISEPELEIINFEVQESAETEEIDEEQEDIVYNSEEEEEEEEEEISEEESEEDIDEMEEEVAEEENGEDYQPPEDVELEVEDKRNVDESETDDDLNDEEQDEDYIEDEEDEFDEEEKSEEEIADDELEGDEQPDVNVEVNELTHSQQSGIREIQIEDLDEEESESIQFTPVSAPAERPVMREIPKPEILLDEKKEEDETFQKERSLNDVISENKSAETNLGNSPISSLRSSIGLNDRFLFIREIFSNNTDKYNMVIDHLDKLETIQQAVDYLKANLTLQKNDTSLKFVDLLKRRFTK